ncbi:Hypothetical predicted protein [Mytilus galloprovincialis]|uniref:Uncharacterized protein n=2 Tax=Mytilus galloprovincialis TaxID=29158 RepID=A0A8B6CX30_MYTGA|nr:Hypothetical predicted protein [Mytilus galloprovincialis]
MRLWHNAILYLGKKRYSLGMMIIAVFLLLVSKVNCGQDCLSCTGVETYLDCNRHETCSNNEVCFKQKYSTLSGKMLYDFGCSMSQVR